MIKEQIVQIIIDDRESRSGLIDELRGYEYENTTTRVTTNVQTARLEVGDIICSDRVCIERKSCPDFVDSFISRDIFGQVADMSRAYVRSIMILEGKTIFGLRDVSPEALRSALSGITVGWGIPILPTANVKGTAAMAVTIARREQFKEKRSISIHGKRSHMTLPQRQEYVVSSIGGGVGPTMAGVLLKHFGSVQEVIDASINELVEVEGIGKKTAENIREIVESEYKS
jgi:Fanconi anemia group M protein